MYEVSITLLIRSTTLV